MNIPINFKTIFNLIHTDKYVLAGKELVSYWYQGKMRIALHTIKGNCIGYIQYDAKLANETVEMNQVMIYINDFVGLKLKQLLKIKEIIQ